MDVPKNIILAAEAYVRMARLLFRAGYKVSDYKEDKNDNVSLIKIQKLGKGKPEKWIKL